MLDLELTEPVETDICAELGNMARQSFLVLALIGLLVAAPAVRVQAQEDDVDEANVVVLTEENFKSELAKAKYALVRGACAPCGGPRAQPGAR